MNQKENAMFKPLIAGLTALSLTFATVAPVQAEGFSREDAGKLLFGLVAIAALNAAIENNTRNDPPATQVHDRAPQANRNRGHDWGRLNRHDRRDLPRECLRGIETRFGTQHMFEQSCLDRNYRQVDSLPARCAVRVYSSNGPRRGYDPLCLREQGYRSDRRR